MNPLVVLNLGPGNCQVGFDNVTVQLSATDGQPLIKCRDVGKLPAAENLPGLYSKWQRLYEALNNPLGLRLSTKDFIEFDDSDAITNVSRADFGDLSEQLKAEINQWLKSPEFRNIDQLLRMQLRPEENIRMIIETDDPLLQKLPWHLWTFFEHYTKAEVALSAQKYGRASQVAPKTNRQMRILVVLGHSDGINVQSDRRMLEEVSAETVVLTEPQRSVLDRYLWDEQGWDILFFAGHSTSHAVDEKGGFQEQLYINPKEQLSIDQLRNALRASISRGLKLAIFNSCDGLGLARALADLNLPQLIVMREPVIDPVAHTFLKNFLRLFSLGEPFYTAVRYAREQLQGIEGEFPGASWLPVIFQNPTEAPITWTKGLGQPRQQPLRVEPPVKEQPPALTEPVITWRKLLIASVAVTLPLLGIRALGFLQGPELSAYDRLMRARPVSWEQMPIDKRLLVIEINEDDTDDYGYPIRDATLATVLDTLQQAQPRAVGVDMHRYQVNEPGREELLQQFRQSPDLITVCAFDKNNREILSHPPEFSPEQAQAQVGFSDLETDDEFQPGRATVRRQLLSYDPKLGPVSSLCSTPYSLSLNLALRYLQAEGVQPLTANAQQNWQMDQVTFNRMAQRMGGYQKLDGLSSQVLLNYRFTPKPAQRISLTDLLEGRIDASDIRDRVVLIGVSDPIANDYRETPYGELPGVWVHAHSVSQILAAVLDERPLMWALPQLGQLQWGDMVWIWGWSLVGGLLIWRVRSVIFVAGVSVVMVLGLRQICLVLLVKGGWVPFIPALVAFVVTAGVLMAYKRGYFRQIDKLNT